MVNEEENGVESRDQFTLGAMKQGKEPGFSSKRNGKLL